MELYYDGPMQLRFRHPRVGSMVNGIGFHDYIVNIHNGEAFSTKEILDAAASCGVEDDVAIVEWSDWAPLGYV